LDQSIYVVSQVSNYVWLSPTLTYWAKMLSHNHFKLIGEIFMNIHLKHVIKYVGRDVFNEKKLYNLLLKLETFNVQQFNNGICCYFTSIYILLFQGYQNNSIFLFTCPQLMQLSKNGSWICVQCQVVDQCYSLTSLCGHMMLSSFLVNSNISVIVILNILKKF
jgi:hypothetical protein